MTKLDLRENIKSAWKSLKAAGSSLIFGAALAASNLLMPYNSQATEFSLFQEHEVGARIEMSPVKRIDNIPLEVRDVPVHPWDVHTLGNITKPIEEDYALLPPRMQMIDMKTGGQVVAEKIKGCLGAGLELVVAGGDRQERVYDDNAFDPKKTYYSVLPTFSFHIPILRPYLFSELRTQFTKTFGIDLGYKLSQETIGVKNGWGRHTSSDGKYDYITKDRWDLVSMDLGTAYASFRWLNSAFERMDCVPQYFSFDVGASKAVDKKFTDIGRKTDFTFNEPAWYVGAKIIFRLPED